MKKKNRSFQSTKNKNGKSKILKNTLWKVAPWCILSNVPILLKSVLLGVRNKQIADDYVPSNDPIAMFVEYFGKIQPDTTEQDKIR